MAGRLATPPQTRRTRKMAGRGANELGVKSLLLHFRVKTKRGTTLVQKLRWEITLCTLSRMVERLPFSWSEAISAVAQER